MKVRYIGATDAQVAWGGNDDPRDCLVEGETYTLDKEEIHSYHTKYILTEFPNNKFNSVSFQEVKEIKMDKEELLQLLKANLRFKKKPHKPGQWPTLQLCFEKEVITEVVINVFGGYSGELPYLNIVEVKGEGD